MLDIRTTTYHFFVIVCLAVQPKAPGWAHAAWSWHKCSQDKNKLTQRDTINVATLISNVDVMNRGYCEKSNEKLMFL